jgi:hypothetical protein
MGILRAYELLYALLHSACNSLGHISVDEGAAFENAEPVQRIHPQHSLHAPVATGSENTGVPFEPPYKRLEQTRQRECWISVTIDTCLIVA